jgi:hypothetical protein
MKHNADESLMIWALKQAISGQTQEHTVPETNVSISATEIKLNDLQKDTKQFKCIAIRKKELLRLL